MAIESGSFRDPSGFIFYNNNSVYRQINQSYRNNYDLLLNSGLYETLKNKGLLIPHIETDILPPNPKIAYKVIKPDTVPFISYPYEWCFGQLKAAALLTLEIQQTAIEHAMVLKDASAFNIQFINSKPVLIDTLSFEEYIEGEPWIGYRQFCQHFLAPLALMAYSDVRLNKLLRLYIDGIPLDLANNLLPLRAKFKPSLLIHIVLHSMSQKYFSKSTKPKMYKKVSLQSLKAFISSLESTINSLNWSPEKSEWDSYYLNTNYTPKMIEEKVKITNDFVSTIKPKNVWDLGGNTGFFSRIASLKEINTITFDGDYSAVEKNYQGCLKNNDKNILPLILDLTNPSPAIGWRNEERKSLIERGPADTIFALALIHHLAISNNVPLPEIAGFMANICNNLIIEFIPKNDSQVQKLLDTRKDIFTDYTQNSFEEAFKEYFTIISSKQIAGSQRTMYLMKKIIKQ